MAVFEFLRDVVVCKQVAWYRYLISFQMELADKKCRPRGSPPRDGAFAALSTRVCTFPDHDSDCKFAQYFHRCDQTPSGRHVQAAHLRSPFLL
jgi:hypothetical protein